MHMHCKAYVMKNVIIIFTTVRLQPATSCFKNQCNFHITGTFFLSAPQYESVWILERNLLGCLNNDKNTSVTMYHDRSARYCTVPCRSIVIVTVWACAWVSNSMVSVMSMSSLHVCRTRWSTVGDQPFRSEQFVTDGTSYVDLHYTIIK